MLCVNISAYLDAHTCVASLGSQKKAEGIRSYGAGVGGDCECWELWSSVRIARDIILGSISPAPHSVYFNKRSILRGKIAILPFL